MGKRILSKDDLCSPYSYLLPDYVYLGNFDFQGLYNLVIISNFVELNDGEIDTYFLRFRPFFS